MNFHLKIAVQTVIYGSFGAIVGLILLRFVPSEGISETLKLLGSITAVAGSLLGWSAGWLDQSRTLVKGVDYNAAVRLFDELGRSQKKLIWRWAIALTSSLLVVAASPLVKDFTLGELIYVKIAFVIAIASFSISVLSIFSLFRSMLNSASLKADLEEHERQELRRIRNTPPELMSSHTNQELMH